MRRPKQTSKIFVVFSSCVCVADDKANRRTCRFPFKYATHQFHPVFFMPACHQRMLAGTPAVEFVLNIIQINLYSCRHAVHYSADGFPVAFTKGCQGKYVSKSISHENEWNVMSDYLMIEELIGWRIPLLMTATASAAFATSVAAFFVVFSAAATTSAASAAHLGYKGLQFFIGRLSLFHHLTYKV